MLKIYRYCFYRFVGMWIRFGFAKEFYGLVPKDNMSSIFLSSISMVSLIQLSNLNTLLIVPVVLQQKQFSANILAAIIFALVIGNFFFLNKKRLYDKCEAQWKNESKRNRIINKWLVVVFFIASMVMMFVSMKIVYLPHSLTIPYWGNDWGGQL